MNFDPARIYHMLMDSGQAWADAHYEAELLSETRKSLLATIKMEHLNGSNMSQVQAETLALADARYRAHIDGMVAAQHKANMARVEYDSAKVLADLRRTEQSNLRIEKEKGL